jgi:hypothetical protein
MFLSMIGSSPSLPPLIGSSHFPPSGLVNYFFSITQPLHNRFVKGRRPDHFLLTFPPSTKEHAQSIYISFFPSPLFSSFTPFLLLSDLPLPTLKLYSRLPGPLPNPLSFVLTTASIAHVFLTNLIAPIRRQLA